MAQILAVTWAETWWDALQPDQVAQGVRAHPVLGGGPCPSLGQHDPVTRREEAAVKESHDADHIAGGEPAVASAAARGATTSTLKRWEELGVLDPAKLPQEEIQLALDDAGRQAGYEDLPVGSRHRDATLGCRIARDG